MFTPQNILVPTDFSEPSAVVLAYAKDIARGGNSTLHLLHAVEPVIYPVQWGYANTEFAQAGRHLAEVSEKELQRMAGELAAEGFSVRTKTVQGGSASGEIVEYAKNNGIDLICIATHGRDGLERFFLGSTAERILRKAECPVLIVKRSDSM